MVVRRKQEKRSKNTYIFILPIPTNNNKRIVVKLACDDYFMFLGNNLLPVVDFFLLIFSAVKENAVAGNNKVFPFRLFYERSIIIQ